MLEVLGQISRAELTMYPEREPVERLVAEHLRLKPAQVLLTNGVDEAIHVLCQTYLGAGDEMLLPVPTYSMYAVYASATDASLVEVQADADFGFPLEALAREDHASDEGDCDRQSEQPDGAGSTARQISCGLSKRLRRRWCWWTRRISIFTDRR